MPRQKRRGPIEHFSWGRFVVDGQEHSEDDGLIAGAGKDIRILGREVSEWQERQGHRLKRGMITGVFDHDVEVLVIGTGVEAQIKCPKRVRKAIRRRGIDRVILRPTPKAVKTYNKLFRKGKRVAMLAHGTC
jgi:hypothetical protein